MTAPRQTGALPVEPPIVAELRRWTSKGPNRETNTEVVDYIDALLTAAASIEAENQRLKAQVEDLQGQLNAVANEYYD